MILSRTDFTVGKKPAAPCCPLARHQSQVLVLQLSTSASLWLQPRLERGVNETLFSGSEWWMCCFFHTTSSEVVAACGLWLHCVCVFFFFQKLVSDIQIKPGNVSPSILHVFVCFYILVSKARRDHLFQLMWHSLELHMSCLESSDLLSMSLFFFPACHRAKSRSRVWEISFASTSF